MDKKGDLSRFCCQNHKCTDYGKRGAGNLSVSDHYGKQNRRMFWCKTCKSRFSEQKGTPLFGSRLPREKVVLLLAHIQEGVGTLKTSRLLGISKNTVTRYSRLAGEHAKSLHEELVAFSPSDEGGSTRRKMGIRRQKAEELRPRRSRRQTERR